jgi:hypothetical protein
MTAAPLQATHFQTLSLLVHADAKVGKSTLAATAPLPMLVLDAEGGWKFIANSPLLVALYGRPLNVRYWDPVREPIPVYDGTWEICQVIVRDWLTVQRAYDWVSQTQHPFVTIVIDSISEIQRRLKANLVGTEAMKMQDWGVLLNVMDAVIRGFRDLTMIPGNARVTVFVAETRESKSGKWRPYMQGQIEVSLPYWMDVVGYLYVDHLIGPDGQSNGQVIRRLLVTPNNLYEAGERVQGRLGQVVDNPNISTMLQMIYPSS